MAGTTPVYGLPYQTLGDAPNGAQGLQDLATAVEGVIVRLDTGVAVHVRTVAGSANFVKPTSPRARLHLVRIWGAGGAGGGAGASSGSNIQGEGAGGGAGGYVEKWYDDAELAASEPYTVGAGGTGGGGLGASGGDTTFKGLTASGGTGGAAMASTTQGTATGGTGGGAAGGDLNCAGGAGGKGRVISSQAILASYGGASPGGGGTVQTPGAAAAGATGASPGGGGSGAFGSTTGVFSGGNGAAGKIEIVSIY